MRESLICVLVLRFVLGKSEILSRYLMSENNVSVLGNLYQSNGIQKVKIRYSTIKANHQRQPQRNTAYSVDLGPSHESQLCVLYTLRSLFLLISTPSIVFHPIGSHKI